MKKFYVQRGSQVRAGELLAVVENSNLTAAELENTSVYQAAQGAYATGTRPPMPAQGQTAGVAPAAVEHFASE